MTKQFFSIQTSELIDLSPDKIKKWREDHRASMWGFLHQNGEVLHLDERQSAKSMLLAFIAELSEESAQALMEGLFDDAPIKIDAAQTPIPSTLSPRDVARKKRIEGNGMRYHNPNQPPIDTDSDTGAGDKHSEIQRRKAEARRQRIEGNGMAQHKTPLG